jgi:hypothetical protein
MFFVAPGAMEKLQREGGAPDFLINTDERGERCFYIFSDKELCIAYIKNSGIKEWRCENMVASGADLFVSLPQDASNVVINPLTPFATSYEKEMFETLRQIADAIFIEKELRALSDGSIANEAALNRIVADFKRYEYFHLVCFLTENGEWTYLRYETDDKLLWVVAFTAIDNANAYLKECASQLPGRYKIERLNGLNLAQTALALDSPGILFNWRGYVRPLMLNSQFLKIVCAAP